jgi:hypothetical protein
LDQKRVVFFGFQITFDPMYKFGLNGKIGGTVLMRYITSSALLAGYFPVTSTDFSRIFLAVPFLGPEISPTGKSHRLGPVGEPSR